MFNNTSYSDVRCMSAAHDFLVHRGYDVTPLDEFDEVDLLAINGDVAALVSVTACEGEKFQEELLPRETYERVMLRCAYEELVDVGMQIRCDAITVCVVGPDRAVVRHHLSAVA